MHSGLLEKVDVSALPIPSGAVFDPLPEPAPDTPGAAAFSAFLDDARGRHLITFIQAHSPYLSTLLRREPQMLAALAARPYADVVAAVLNDLDTAWAAGASERELMSALRRAKRQIALCVAIGDLLDLCSLDDITASLTTLAERALQCACEHAFATWRRETGSDGTGCQGYVILGMGKFGGGELNYSSDIDLVALYDPPTLKAADPDRMRQDMIRLTRQIMRLMDERTADGYVFRTDLRLRPDPSATPMALTVSAAETYYESLGQNWERAAMIKARPVAGDIALGEGFLAHIRPFVWRKYLDFAAIQDIHSIKRQINAHRGGRTVEVDGHNIKIGKGGIREIEFFAQTQQLIWGGRQPELRERKTCSVLHALTQEGHVATQTADEMTAAYHFLRRLEHRLQMIDDQQTQTLPDTPDRMDALARFSGYADTDQFRDDVRARLTLVANHYAQLFEESPDLGSGGALVFTGVEDDPETLTTLSEMGFANPSHVAGRVRVWHHGRYRATRSERSRQILTELMPHLLKALGDTADPDEAFARFDSFLSGLPSGVQLFSLFQAHPALLELVSEVLGSAPRLADWMARRPALLDSVLSGDFFDPITAETETAAEDEELHVALEQARDFQDILDAVRRWTNDRKFKAGVQIMRGIVDGDSVGPALSRIAETGLEAILPAAEKEFAEQHGSVPGHGVAVVAFGKLGGRELLPRSDLDLVFVYDVAPDADGSDGPRPIGPQVYYLRLCQRFITAITTETGEGSLYEVDNRLRPSGKAGPLATQLDGFTKYYDLDEGEAWTWEHMALTRARAVYGAADLCDTIDTAIRNALVQRRDAEKVIRDVDDMRQRVAREFPGKSDWDIKYRPGGLVDIEFIAQALQLIHAADDPTVLSPNTAIALENLARAGKLDASPTSTLRQALALWRRLQAFIRLTGKDGTFDPADAPAGQIRAIQHVVETDSIDAALARVSETANEVRSIYNSLIAEPADGYRAEDNHDREGT